MLISVTEYQRRNPDVKETEEDFDSEESESRQIPDFIGSNSKEFPNDPVHPIQYYYNLNHFLILSPSPKEREKIDNESRSKLALSTLAVALNNTKSPIPAFVQVMDRSKQIFNGFSVGGGLRVNYEMIVLGRRPPHCDHLTGLLNLFKSKIYENSDSEIELPSVKVCAKFSYVLGKF